MLVYPTDPARRARALLRDGAMVLAVAVFAWLGLRVGHGVDRLAVVGRDFAGGGAGAAHALASAADAAGGVPIVGGDLAAQLRRAASSASAATGSVGATEQRDVHLAAIVLGLAVFLAPTAWVLGRLLPGRVAEVRRLRAVGGALRPGASDGLRRLVALRASVELPPRELLRFTPDPAGDLLAGRLEPLLAAAAAGVGLRRGRGRGRGRGHGRGRGRERPSGQ